jgi:hypothetical protein
LGPTPSPHSQVNFARPEGPTKPPHKILATPCQRLIRPFEVCRFLEPALYLSSRPSFVVIPALSRDPVCTAALCKGRRSTRDPGSSPGMTNTRTVQIFQLHRAGSIG